MTCRSPEGLGHRWILLAWIIVLLPLSVSAESPCGQFELVPTPEPGTASNALVDVAAVGDGTAWAIGSQSGDSTTSLILYYDGGQWSEFSMPAEAEDVALGAIGNTPEGDVWMVGTRPYSVYEVEVFYLRARDGVIDRVDSFLSGGGPLHVSAAATNNVWGVSGGLWPADQGGYVQHFDGSDWSTTQLPAAFLFRNQPQAIYVAGPDDVWVAGVGGDGRFQYIGYVQHWDGSSWETVPTPFDGQNLTYFLSIDGSSSNNIWVAGHINHTEDLLLHWDGSSWTQHEGSAPDSPLQDIVVLGPASAWATPHSLSPGSSFFYWNGIDWSVAGVPDVRAQRPSIGAACPGAVPATCGPLALIMTVRHITPSLRSFSPKSRRVFPPPEESAPRAVVLRGNHPNPFNPSTVITYELPVSQNVELVVYSADGRLVRTLFFGVQDAGLHRVAWNGRDAVGRQVASGTYLYQVRHADGSVSGKMTLTK